MMSEKRRPSVRRVAGSETLPQRDSTWIGVDPGGSGNFGLAILDSNGAAQTFCVDCADEAVAKVLKHVPGTPAGVGVDAPLWWSSGRSGDRLADQWLRKRYSLSGGQVQTVNSLRGAALAQGMMFAQRIREHFPSIQITESHPKALLFAHGGIEWSAFAVKYSVSSTHKTEHERDALISAVVAREGFEGRWRNDLSKTRHECEQDTEQFWLAPIHYYWPET